MKTEQRGLSTAAIVGIVVTVVVVTVVGGVAAVLLLKPGAPTTPGITTTTTQSGTTATTTPGTATTTTTTPGTPSQATALYLETAEFTDHERTGVEAFSIITPADWQFQGGIRWRTERPLLPASLAFQVASSSGLGLEVFPDEAYFWVEGKGLLVPYDYGPELQAQYALEYQGYGARQPTSAAEYISGILIPQYRASVSDLQIVSITPLDESDLVYQLENLLAQRPQGPFPEQISVDAAGMRATYEENGRKMEEEFWAIIVVDTFSTTPEMEQTTGVRMSSTFWYASGLWSVKAGEGNLSAENAKMLMTVLNSFQWNSAWIEQYTQLLNEIWQLHLQGIMERHQALTQAQNEVTRIITTTFSNQEETMERISDRWSEVIRGVETYDPAPGLTEFGTDGQPSVELPNGYDHAWTNGQGDYILTDSALFNPNTDLETGYNWVQMAKIL